MKIFHHLFTASIISIAIACGGNANKNENKNEEEQTAGSDNADQMEDMRELDLNKFDLNASIKIPDDAQGKANISSTDWGSIEITVGDAFGIEIVPYGMAVMEKKTELDADLVYNIEYVIDSENKILYKKTIKDSDVEPEFHFFMTKKFDGETVEIKSMSDRTFTKKQVEKMMKSAQTLASKKAAV